MEGGLATHLGDLARATCDIECGVNLSKERTSQFVKALSYA